MSGKKITFDEMAPLEPEGVDGDEPFDPEKELKLPIISKAIEGDEPVNLEEEHLGYPEERLTFKRPKE